VTRLRVIVEADGGARGNPGPAGFGAVVREAGTGEVLAERLGALGVTTNNVAEYSGLIAGLQAAADLGAVEVEVRMDSKLVVEQMSGRWKIKHENMRPLAAKAAALVGRFRSVTFTWVPRESNKHADALANAAMDGKSSVEDALPAPDAKIWEPPASTATRLILVRHCETELTAQRRYSGRGDVPLSPAGRAQARTVASQVAGLGVELAAVVTSPLKRCVETARAIAGSAVPVVSDADLVECDFGDWEGLTFAEVRQRWPVELDDWLGSTSVAPPGGESFAEVAVRVARAVEKLPAEYLGRAVAVVSHVTPIKLILRDALAATDALLHRLFLSPGGLSIVDRYPDGGVAVRTVNATAPPS
jgi:probable phosphoglycerate mutase